MLKIESAAIPENNEGKALSYLVPSGVNLRDYSPGSCRGTRLTSRATEVRGLVQFAIHDDPTESAKQ